jgi:hypothetical protein
MYMYIDTHTHTHLPKNGEHAVEVRDIVEWYLSLYQLPHQQAQAVSICQHLSASVSICQRYLSLYQLPRQQAQAVSICQHLSAHVSIRRVFFVDMYI